ncbi:MAG: YeeE/YedE thiosulfate transporter family protein [Thermoplasmata archaeon]
MLDQLHGQKRKQLLIGFLIGIAFGFLLDRGGTTDVNIIVNQLLLKDFTVLKIMFTAIITGMIGVHFIVKHLTPELQPKPCPWKTVIIGGLIFGIGFALLGLCQGTALGAVGTGSVHALIGVIGMFIGAGMFASLYPHFKGFMDRCDLGKVTIPDLLGVNTWWIILVISAVLIGIMYYVEMKGL